MIGTVAFALLRAVQCREFFFINDPAPPEISSLPHPASLPFYRLEAETTLDKKDVLALGGSSPHAPHGDPRRGEGSDEREDHPRRDHRSCPPDADPHPHLHH